MTARELAGQICVKLREAGHQAYLVGGCVRDLLLGREPVDWDVSTDARPERVQELFPDSLAVGAQFGVAIVLDEGAQVEVATFRSDIGYSDGRHPDRVDFTGSAEEDVRRRDFTINALLMDSATAQVRDYVGGRADLRAGIIRAIGKPEARFHEDKLRMIRAVRFAARFGYTIEPATFAAIQKLAGEVNIVSAERIRDELTKILTEGAARRGFELLDVTGLLREVLPEIKALQGVAQQPEFHPEGDVWIHTLLMLDGLRDATPTLALGVLLHDVGKPPTFTVRERIRFDNHVEVGAKMAESICARLRLSARDTERVVELVRHHLRFKDFPRMKRSTQLRFLRMEGFEEHLELHRLDCLSSHGDLANYELAKKLLEETPAEEIKPQPLLRGDDLIGQGYTPGPQFKTILQTVEDAQLEGKLQSRDEALRLVAERFPLGRS